MMTHNNLDNHGWATRGAAVVRVLLIILGALQAAFGMILLIACIALLADGDSDMLFLLPFALLTLIGGVVIIIGQAQSAKEQGSSPDSVGTVAKTPIDIPMPVAPQQPSASSSSPVPEPVAQPAPTATEDVAHLVFRSGDLFATLRDLVRHASTPGSDKYHLAGMLQAAGIMNWTDAPACEGGRLSRNTHFWIRLNTDNLTPQQYDTLITTEAALGVNQDLPSVRTYGCADQRTMQEVKRLMREMSDQTIETAALADEGLRVCYHDTDPAQTPGEWLVRARVCNAAECVRTPFRVVYDLRCNLEEGLVVLGLEVPRTQCMAIFTPDALEQVGLARAYALRLAALLARHAFAASDRVRRVVVNCHEHDDAQTILSLDLTKQLLQHVCNVARGTVIEGAFPTDDNIRYTFDERGWFAPIEPIVALDDPIAFPAASRTVPELDQRMASEAVARTCHVKRICEMGINESAPRVAAWSQLRSQLGTTTEQAASALVAARDASVDITVAEACTRTVQALVNGTADLDNLDALGDLFVDGSALDRAVVRANQLLDDSDGREDPEAALRVLETALAPIDDMGVYLDDETYVYRYFGSVAERIHHNRVIDEGGREIRLVPDAYFNAHVNASIALGMLGRNEEAMKHADICLRLAPTSTYATMRKVRILEAESRSYDAADLIIRALRHAVTPRDASICHYRLAYMEWKLGREDLAVACYQRSMNWDTEMSSQAREELDDLLENSPNLSRLTDEQADALLAREDIPLGCVRTDGERVLAAAVACMDDAAFLSARPLMATLYGMNNDDVVMGVYRSLSVSL